MKNFKDFISEEKPNIKRKAKGEQDFVDAHEVEVTDPENSGTEGPAKVTTKAGSGKRKADKDNKQEFGEEVEEIDELDTSTLASYREKSKGDVNKGKKTVNRMMGQMRSDVRLMSRSLGKKSPFGNYTKEEVEEFDEELTSDQIQKHKQLAAKHRTIAKSSGGDKRVAHQRAANLHAGAVKNPWHKKGSSDAHSASKKLGVSEEFELTEEEILELDEAKTALDHDWKSSKEPGVMTKQKVGEGGHREYKIKHAGQTVQFKVPFTQDKEHGLSHHLSKIDHEGIRKHLTKKHGASGRNSSTLFGASHSDIVSGAKEYMEKNSVKKEEVELDEAEAPFTPDKPKKNPPAIAGKHGQGPSTAKHLANQGMQKTLRQMKKSKEMKTEEEEVEEKYVTPGLEKLAAQKKKTLQQKRKPMQEADFSKKETKMAHTIGKEFEKKGVGDESKGGPYAVASAMVRDRPEAAKKAYKTIQSKTNEEADAELLFNLYNDLNEENQEMFMSQLEEDADSLLEFARMMEEE